MGNRASKLPQLSRKVPCKLESRFMHSDPDIRLFIGENLVKIVELNRWAAREISQEPLDKESVLAALLAKASVKVDSEWFGSLDHPKKDQLRHMVMLNIECT